MPRQKQDESFVRNIGTIESPKIINSEAIKDNSGARVVETIGNIFTDAYRGYEEAKLTGPNVLAEQDAESVKKGPKAQRLTEAEAIEATKDDLNLRRIENMRRQDIISHDTAKVLASKAVAAASARLPGRAAEYRKQASEFFGDFGEGQGLLEPTSAEKEGDKAAQRIENHMIDLGIVIRNEDGTFTTHQSTPLYNIYDNHKRLELATKEAELRTNQAVALGKPAAAHIGVHAQTLVRKEINKLTPRLAAAVDSKQPENQEKIDLLFASADQSVAYEVNKRIAKANVEGSLIDPSQVKQIHTLYKDELKLLREAFNPMISHIFYKNHGEALTELIKIGATSKMPDIVAMETIMKGSGQAYIGLITRLGNMTPAQRDNYFTLNPGDRILYDTGVMVDKMKDSIMNLAKDAIPDAMFDKDNYKLTIQTGIHILNNPELRESNPTLGQSITKTFTNTFIRNGDPTIAEALANPKTKILVDDNQAEKIFNAANNRAQQAILSIMGSGSVNATSNYAIVFDQKTKSFKVSGEVPEEDSIRGDTDWAALEAHSRQEQAVEHLNRAYKIINTYRDTKAGEKILAGRTPEQYLMDKTKIAKDFSEKEQQKASEKLKSNEAGNDNSRSPKRERKKSTITQSDDGSLEIETTIE